MCVCVCTVAVNAFRTQILPAVHFLGHTVQHSIHGHRVPQSARRADAGSRDQVLHTQGVSRLRHTRDVRHIRLLLPYSNVIFTVIFATEMVLKILGEGCYNYINDGFSMFDGIVVVVRQVEIKRRLFTTLNNTRCDSM